MPCQMTNVAWVPKSCVTGCEKSVSPITKNSAAATAPTYGRPLTRQPTTAVSTIAAAHSPGMASRSATTGRSMCPMRLIAAMCT
jgi:hypothetical protein